MLFEVVKDAVLVACMSAFLLPSIDEWPGTLMSFIKFPLVWWIEIMRWIFFGITLGVCMFEILVIGA